MFCRSLPCMFQKTNFCPHLFENTTSYQSVMWWLPSPPRLDLRWTGVILLFAASACDQCCPWLLKALGHHPFWKSHLLLLQDKCPGNSGSRGHRSFHNSVLFLLVSPKEWLCLCCHLQAQFSPQRSFPESQGENTKPDKEQGRAASQQCQHCHMMISGAERPLKCSLV